VYVGDIKHNVVDVFKPEAGGGEKYVRQIAGTSPTEPFTQVFRVVVDESNGDVLVDDGSVVDVFEPTGLNEYVFVRQITGTPGESFTAIYDVAADSNGDIYVVPARNSDEKQEIDQFSAAGLYLGRITGTLSGTFRGVVQSVAADSATHHVYAGDARVELGPEQVQGVVDVFGGSSLVVPDVTTDAASSMKAGVATLEGTVNPDGAGDATCRFVWGTSTAFGRVAPCSAAVANGSSPVPVSAEISGLEPDRTYYYRLQASNAKGTNLGEAEQDRQFVSAGPGTRGESVSDVASSSATLEAQVEPNGTPTFYYFQYGSTSAYGTDAPELGQGSQHGEAIGSGSGFQGVSGHLQGLTPGNTYHYRVVVVSEPMAGEYEAFDGPDQLFVTQAVGTGFALTDGRAWELVSPPDKHGADFMGVGEQQGAVIQASVDGGAMTYAVTSPIVANPPGNRSFEATQVFSTRSAPGEWESQDIATPHTEGSGEILAGETSEYRSFSSDLSLGLVQPVGETPLPPLPAGSESTDYLRSLDGEYKALVTSANVPLGTKFGKQFKFEGASPDLSHVVIDSKVALTPPRNGEMVGSGEPRLYEWAEGQLRPVSVLPDEEETRGSLGDDRIVVRHAVSDDGSRIVWGFGTGPHFLRDMTRKETVRVDAPAEGLVEGNGQTYFQTASSAGSTVFFAHEQPLTRNATASTGLYVFEVTSGGREPLAGRLISLTEEGKVLGVAGASEDGSDVYFVDSGALGDGAGRGAEKGGYNLYVDHYDKAGKAWAPPKFIAGLSSEDAHSWGISVQEKRLRRMTSRVSPDGRYLTFMSERSLTGYDNRDANSGALDEEVFLYDASSGRIVCASCDPTGARPVGMLEPPERPGPLVDHAQNWENRWLAANIPGWTTTGQLTPNTYQSRFLSDGGRLFFNSPDALVPADVNGVEDVYEYEPAGVGSCEGPGHGGGSGVVFSQSVGGCVALVSSGKSSDESAFMDASEGGGDVFFLTSARLSPLDYDTAVDLYDAHVCTSTQPCPSNPALVPPPCTTGDACKAAPSPQPAGFGAPSSETFSGAGNVAGSGAAVVVRSKRLTGAERLAKALRGCAKKQKRKQGACRRGARKRYGPSASRARKSLSNGIRR